MPIWLLYAVLLAAPAQSAPPAEAPPRAALYLTAFNAQDTDAVTRLYAADAVFLPFTGQLITGGATIGPALARIAAKVKLELQPKSSGGSDQGWFESGTWRHLDRESGAVMDSGAYLWIWRKEPDGGWKIIAHSVSRKAT